MYNSPASPKKSNEKSQGRETAPRWDANLLRSILPDFAHKLTNFSAIFTGFIPKKFYIRSAKHTGGGGIRIIYLPSTEPSIYRVGQFSAEPAMWPH